MESNQMILAAFSVGLLLVLRGYMSLGMREFQTKKEWKRYKEEVPAVERWFFWTAPRTIGDKYSKAEKKKIRYDRAAEQMAKIIDFKGLATPEPQRKSG